MRPAYSDRNAMTYIQPEFERNRFTCPTCGTLSQMIWLELFNPWEHDAVNAENWELLEDYRFHAAVCVADGCVSIWLRYPEHTEEGLVRRRTEMAYPPASHGPKPNPDMPESAKKLYLEAGNVLPGSTRAAAALLRMCTEDIIKFLATKQDKEKVLDERTSLYRRVEFLREHDKLWPAEEIDDALDLLRVIGNDAVHSPEPREIRGDDDTRQVARSLFMLVDMITEQLITRRRRARSLKKLIEENS